MANRSIDEKRICERLKDRVGSYFPGMAGAAKVTVIKRKRRAYSQIYELGVFLDRQRTRRVIVKVAGNAQRQFEELASIWSAFEHHPTCSIPKPLDYFEDPSALVTEAVPGRSVQSLFPRFFWHGYKIGQAELACRLAGQWLAIYHGLTEDGADTIDVKGKLADFRRAWGGLVAVGFDEKVGRSIESLLATAADKLTGVFFPLVRVHGDFSIDNVWMYERRVAVFDVSGIHRNAPELDASSFLNSLLFLRLSGRLPTDVFLKLRAAFFEGYAQKRSLNLPAVNFLQATGAVDVLAEIWARRPWRLTRFLARPVVAGLFDILQSERNPLAS